MSAPNLFILGAAKCGTSSMHAILGQHPDIHASRVKEPGFFTWPNQYVRNPFAYFKLFDSPKRYRLESSVNYLVNPGTASVLHSLFPDARFIVLVREPSARAYSQYRFMYHLGFEDIPTFAAALRAEEFRYTSQEFFQTNPLGAFWAYLYCRSTLYDVHLARYWDLFDRKQFCVVSLAELSMEPIGTTESILDFLGLDPSPARHFDFAIKNRLEIEKPRYDAESDRIMRRAFEGLTERTDRFVGRNMDWSM